MLYCSSTQDDDRLQFHIRRRQATVPHKTMTAYSSTKDICNSVLTVDMVDVVGAYLRVVCLFPAQGQFVSDAVSKRLWFRKPATNTKYLQNNFRKSPNGNLRFTSIRTTQKNRVLPQTYQFMIRTGILSDKKNVFTAV